MLGGGPNVPLTARELRGLKFAAFVAIVLATVALIGMIIALILLGLATDTVNNLKISDGCNDYNDCTYDYEKDSGGCINLPKNQGDSCISECYEADATDQTCSNLQLTAGVLTPVCTSPSQEFCKGFCLSDGDCPVLSTVAGNVAGECFATTCYYRIDPTSGVTVNGNEIPELICSQDYQVFQTTCKSYLNTSNTLVQSRCIISDVQCETVSTNLGTAAAPICYYYHACSVQQYIPVVTLTRSISMARNTDFNNNNNNNNRNQEFSGMKSVVRTKNGKVIHGSALTPEKKSVKNAPKFSVINHKYDPKNRRVNKPFQPPVIQVADTENENKEDPLKETNVPRSKLGIRF